MYTLENELVIKEWDWCKNIKATGITPFDVTCKSDKKVWWKCSFCSLSYLALVKDRTRKGRIGCSNCLLSKNETKISEILDELQITYIAQYRFKDCKDKRSLPFDFVVFKDNKPLLIIEYDGEHHYHPWRFKDKEFAIKKLKDTQRRDKIKNEYCEMKGIDLLRIPYWETEKIGAIIKDKLIEHELINKNN